MIEPRGLPSLSLSAIKVLFDYRAAKERIGESSGKCKKAAPLAWREREREGERGEAQAREDEVLPRGDTLRY